MLSLLLTVYVARLCCVMQRADTSDDPILSLLDVIYTLSVFWFASTHPSNFSSSFRSLPILLHSLALMILVLYVIVQVYYQ